MLKQPLHLSEPQKHICKTKQTNLAICVRNEEFAGEWEIVI